MGPLAGIKVIELVGTGPGPFAAMVLADMGAEVIRVSRTAGRSGGLRAYDPRLDLMNRNRRSMAVDLKDPRGTETVLQLVERADALIEPFRPGVTERLGLGPDACLERNPRLVYARMTGWGQTGPYADKAGHDINYIALNGVLSLLGRENAKPTPPFNLVGDFGGGAMFLTTGLLAALLHAGRTGEGQVLDIAMVDGAALLATVVHTLRAMGNSWGPRGTNMLDTGAPFYEVYETADGKYMSVGSIEPQFYRELLLGLGLEAELESLMMLQQDRSTWVSTKERFAALFAARPRADWEAEFESRDACVAPVLDLDEALVHPHMSERGTYIEYLGIAQPAPAPRFSATPTSVTAPPPRPDEHSAEILRDWGIPGADELIAAGVVADEASHPQS
jgi:alpha-methylacyl-CoA racemase